MHELGGVTLVAHSHGGQVLAYALASMSQHTREACDAWTHLHSERGWASKFRWLGNRFGDRELDVADHNIEITGGHSGILSDPAHLLQWDVILPGLQDGPARQRGVA